MQLPLFIRRQTMKIGKLVEHVNRIVGKGGYSIGQLVGYFDEAIDTINADLNVFLPLISEVYEYEDGAAFTLTEAELLLTYVNQTLDNEYTRLQDAFLRNYVAYEASYRILRDEDEDDEVLGPKRNHSLLWYRRLVAAYNDYTVEDTEAISIGGDADELGATTIDDTGTGFYNPLFPYDD